MQVVQEYSKRKQEFPASQGPRPTSSLTGDEVLITATDLEGYGTTSEDASNDPNLSFCSLSMPTSPLREDEVLITEADLEGFDTYADACKDTSVSLNGITETRPMTKRLSCLFTSLKFSRSGQSAASRLAELRAC